MDGVGPPPKPEQPDIQDVEQTWDAFRDSPTTLHEPQYHPGRLLWDRATTGLSGRRRARHAPMLPYALGWTPKDVRTVRRDCRFEGFVCL